MRVLVWPLWTIGLPIGNLQSGISIGPIGIMLQSGHARNKSGPNWGSEAIGQHLHKYQISTQSGQSGQSGFWSNRGIQAAGRASVLDSRTNLNPRVKRSLLGMHLYWIHVQIKICGRGPTSSWPICMGFTYKPKSLGEEQPPLDPFVSDSRTKLYAIIRHTAQ